VWEGKYDEYGNRRMVDLAGSVMPLQKIETIDEPRARAEAQGELFDEEAAHPDSFRNMLIWGDNRLVSAGLLTAFKGKIDLIYIDPPFDVGADFTVAVSLGEHGEDANKEQSALEAVAYRDMWGRGTDSYLHMMYERLTLMRELLSERGSLYVHCDWRVNSLLRGVLDEVFSPRSFQAEIIWQKLRSVKSQSAHFASMHDTIFAYSRADEPSFTPQFVEKDAKLLDTHYRYTEEETGRRYNLADFTQSGSGPSRTFGELVLPPPAGKHWIWSQERIDQAMASGRIVFSSGGRPYVKRYFDEGEGTRVGDIWTDINPVNQVADERVDYATQKPEALLERIISASSREDDLVGDFFCGSGTTGAVAERLGRRWIMADLGRFAIHTTRKRMLEMQRARHARSQAYRPFDVFNLGRYERQWWQHERLKGADSEHRRVVLEFFRAQTLESPPSPLLHGRKGAAYCHVDNIDSLFTRSEVRAVGAAAAHVGIRELFCLAWEFEMDLRIECDRLEQELGLSIRLVTIPREIMEKNRADPPPFFEVATLTAEPIFSHEGTSLATDIKLTSFIPSLAEVPSKELASLKERAAVNGFDFIDFWAVDFDHRAGEPFHHDWQDYRLRKDRSLKLQSEQRHAYGAPGRYTACVKVVDLFGNDTSITVPVDYA